MITKEQVEAAEKRIAEADKLIEVDKELLAQYNEHVRKNLYNELADIICRSGFIDYQNMVVDSAELITSEPRTMGVKRFDIVLHCIDFKD
jgi:dissimilatory sulfite reductase (desulfoviridin) alpha/beta subunit